MPAKPDCALCGQPYHRHNVGSITTCPVIATYRPSPPAADAGEVRTYREGVEASAKVADEESKRLFDMSQNAKTHPDEQDFHSGAGWYAAQIRDKILALPDPAAIRKLGS